MGQKNREGLGIRSNQGWMLFGNLGKYFGAVASESRVLAGETASDFI
jgi:hypothetical protein